MDNKIQTIIGAVDQTGPDFQKAAQNVRDYQKTTEDAKGGVEQLTHAHLSARHVLSLVAMQTGMGTSELMHFYYAITMIPGPLGVALGAVMALKSAMESQQEAGEKSRKENDEFAASLEKYRNFTFAPSAKGAGGEGDKLIIEANTKLNELYEKQAELKGKLLQLPGDFEKSKNLEDEITAQTNLRDLTIERTVKEKAILQEQMELEDKAYQKRATRETTSDEAADKIKAINEELDIADDLAEAADKALHKFNEGEAGFQEHLEDAQKKELAYQKLKSDAQRMEFKETEKYNDAMQEAAIPRSAVDPYDKRGGIESKFNIANAEAELKLAKEKRQIEQTVGLSDEQRGGLKTAAEKKAAVETEQRRLDEQKLLKDLANEQMLFQINADAEILNLHGHHYEAEKRQLDAWYAQEKASHIGQATALKRIDEERAAKAAEIERKHQEEKMNTLGRYNTDIISATLGSGAGNIARMQLEHQEKQREYKRAGKTEEAAAEEAAYEAKIHRMKMESDMELQSKNTVSFQDTGSAWESFITSLNKNPMELLKLKEAQTTNQILQRIEQKGFTSQGVLIG